MATILDAFAIEVGIDLAALRSSATEAQALFDKAQAKIKKDGDDLERKYKEQLANVEKFARNFVKGFAAVLSFEGFKKLITDTARSSTELGNLAAMVGVNVTELDKLSKAVTLTGGNQGDIANIFSKMSFDIAQLNQVNPQFGDFPGWMQAFSHRFGFRNQDFSKSIKDQLIQASNYSRMLVEKGTPYATVASFWNEAFPGMSAGTIRALIQGGDALSAAMDKLPGINQKNVAAGNAWTEALALLEAQVRQIGVDINTLTEPIAKWMIQFLQAHSISDLFAKAIHFLNDSLQALIKTIQSIPDWLYEKFNALRTYLREGLNTLFGGYFTNPEPEGTPAVPPSDEYGRPPTFQGHGGTSPSDIAPPSSYEPAVPPSDEYGRPQSGFDAADIGAPTAGQAGIVPRFPVAPNVNWRNMNAETIARMNAEYDAMPDDLKRNFKMVSGYRPATIAEARRLGMPDSSSQEDIWRRSGHGTLFAAAPPGRSRHQGGLAGDFEGAGQAWFRAHAREFGLETLSPGYDYPHVQMSRSDIGSHRWSDLFRRMHPSAADSAASRVQLHFHDDTETTINTLVIKTNKVDAVGIAGEIHKALKDEKTKSKVFLRDYQNDVASKLVNPDKVPDRIRRDTTGSDTKPTPKVGTFDKANDVTTDDSWLRAIP